VDVEKLIGARFGEWISVGRALTPVPPAELLTGPRVVVVDRPGSVQTQLMLAAPSVHMDDADLPAVMVSAYALGGGMESRIMAVLREEKGYTYGISAQAQSERSDGRFVVAGAVQTEVTGPAVDDLMTILRGYAEGGIQESERVTAVDNLAGRAPLQYERPEAVANTAAQVLANGLPDTHVDDQIAALRSTTVARINEAFATGVRLDKAVLVAVGDGAKITEVLGTAGLGDVTVVPA
jgi:predicted Zn-dependent peptidase